MDRGRNMVDTICYERVISVLRDEFDLEVNNFKKNLVLRYTNIHASVQKYARSAGSIIMLQLFANFSCQHRSLAFKRIQSREPLLFLVAQNS